MNRYIDTLAVVPLPLRSSKHSPAFKLQKNLKQFKTHCRSLSLCSHGWQKIREGPTAGGRHVIYSKDETTDRLILKSQLIMWVSVGLERTDNNMELTTWPQVNMINQKNYYTSVTPSCCEVGYIVVAHIRSFPV